MVVARKVTSRRDKNKRTIWNKEQGMAMVGRHVRITWPSDNTVYTALVVDFYDDSNQHKVLYDSDESIEVLELGDGPQQRSWSGVRDIERDPLVGKRIILFDHGEAPGDEWFDFMRDASQAEDKFQVIILQRIKNVMKEDVVGPMSSGKHAFYRVLNVINDYLALIDLAATDYEMVTSPEAEAEEEVEAEFVADPEPEPEAQPEAEAEAEADPMVSSPSPGPKAADAEDEPQDADKDEEEYDPTKDIDQHEHSDGEVAPLSSSRRRKAAKDVSTAPVLPPVDDDDDLDIDMYKVAKVVSADRIVEADEPFGSGPAVDVDVDQDDFGVSPIRGRAAELGGSHEAHDERVRGSGSKVKRRAAPKPSPFPELDEDENGQDTASDNEDDGLKSKSRRVQCQVGDFIILDTGIGGAPRKAYVEAHLPETDTHFVAFCDRMGGNLQIKLTRDNHRVVNESEGKQLAKTKQDTFDDDVAMASDETPEAKPRRVQKRKAKAPGRQRKRGSRRIGSPEVKGQSANQDICGRCISIVWPGENLVYVALVLGYSSFSLQHQIVYMIDHCIETLNLKYREWTLLPSEKEPWMDNGLVGKRLYVFWPGEYDDAESQELAKQAFGDDTKVPYEAYVLSYIGEGKYKIIYPATEDTEIRVLRATDDEDASALEKEWDLLDKGVKEIEGLPIIGWTD